jgi:CRP/FNR family transcriptional regulator, cyclic AMP receptor protein
MNTKISLFQHSANGIDFKTSDIIFNQGERGDEMYVIIEGEVDVIRNGVIVETRAGGQLIGEISLLESIERVASAVARTDCRVVPLDSKTFLYLIDHNRNFVLDVMRVLVERSTLLHESV